MSKYYRKNYWSIGFQSRLYDLLSPESYFESMRRVVDVVPGGKGLSLLDAGCGSGLLMNFLADRICQGMTYTGIDVLDEGVTRALLRAKKLGLASHVSCEQSDLTQRFTTQKFDVVVAHFSLYTLASHGIRQKVLSNLKSVMNPDGELILVNPSVDYDAGSIIEESIRLDRNRYGVLTGIFKQIFIYPFTKTMGLKFISKQLKSGKWKAYSREELSHELEEAGFMVDHIENVYAGSAFLSKARLKS
ncbi:MAG: class I SAM-dependent methyltransferase [Nitrospinae bacterium]|nr:class I SAM-dependent methyltransferase [Nitrospinota bacterium]